MIYQILHHEPIFLPKHMFVDDPEIVHVIML